MKFYQRLRFKLIIAFFLTTLLPVLFTGFYAIVTSSESLHQQAIDNQQERVRIAKDNINAFLSTVQSDLMFLTESVPLQQYLKFRTDNTGSPEDLQQLEQLRQAVEREFLALSKHRRIYYQVRYLDETGQEVVRIDSDSLKSHIIAQNRLQNKAERYYFKDAIRLPRKQMFISKLDLNRERGAIEKPHKPVIRYALRVDDTKGKRAGIVLTNIDANQFLLRLSNTRLVTDDGFYASHPDKDKRWGRASDLGHGFDIDEEYGHIANKLKGHLATITTDDLTISSNKLTIPGSNTRWTVIVQERTDALLQSVHDFRFTFTLIIIISMIISLGLALYFSTKITHPIEHLTHLANQISKGKKLNESVNIDDEGEIGALAHAFERMRVSMVKALERLQRVRR